MLISAEAAVATGGTASSASGPCRLRTFDGWTLRCLAQTRFVFPWMPLQLRYRQLRCRLRRVRRPTGSSTSARWRCWSPDGRGTLTTARIPSWSRSHPACWPPESWLPTSPALGRLTAVAARLGLDLPVPLAEIRPRRLPEDWLGLLARCDRDDGPAGVIPVAAVLPELDGMRCAIAELESEPEWATIRVHARGWP